MGPRVLCPRRAHQGGTGLHPARLTRRAPARAPQDTSAPRAPPPRRRTRAGCRPCTAARVPVRPLRLTAATTARGAGRVVRTQRGRRRAPPAPIASPASRLRAPLARMVRRRGSLRLRAPALVIRGTCAGRGRVRPRRHPAAWARGAPRARWHPRPALAGRTGRRPPPPRPRAVASALPGATATPRARRPPPALARAALGTSATRVQRPQWPRRAGRTATARLASARR